MITAKVERVSPAMAEDWLTRLDPRQRKLTEARVVALAAEYASGTAPVTSDSVGWSTEGLLINGQHRIAAIARGKRTIEILVTRGLEPVAFFSTDIGKSRTASDVLNRSTHEIAAMRALIAIENGTMFPHQITASVIRSRLEGGWEVSSGLADILVHHQRCRIYGTAAVAGALAFALATDRPRVLAASLSIRDGANLAATSPLLALRHWLEYRGARAQPSAVMTAVLCALRWHLTTGVLNLANATTLLSRGVGRSYFFAAHTLAVG